MRLREPSLDGGISLYEMLILRCRATREDRGVADAQPISGAPSSVPGPTLGGGWGLARVPARGGVAWKRKVGYTVYIGCGRKPLPFLLYLYTVRYSTEN